MGFFKKIFFIKKLNYSQEEIDEAIEAMYRYKDKSTCIYTELRKVAKPDFTEFLIEKKQDATDFLIAVWAWIKHNQIIETPESNTFWRNVSSLSEAQQKLIFKTWMSLVSRNKSKKFYNTSNENEKSYIFGLWCMALCLAIGEELPTKS